MMKSFATFILLLAAFETGFAANTEYIRPGSVVCNRLGVYFKLSEDAQKSDLYNETHLQIDLYTNSNHKKVADADFSMQSGQVILAYTDYQFDAKISYGPDHIPILINIEQPFYAVPKPGVSAKRNFTFSVFCTVPAIYPVNTTNTTADIHAAPRGDIINPTDHVSASINGLKPGNTTKIGDHLTYTVFLNDNTYAALLPVNCKYYNPNNEVQNVPFVSDNCPRVFPQDPDAYFTTMVKKNATSYEINFRAFSFETTSKSVLGISCDLQLCITQNYDACYKPCWGGPAPPTGTAASTTQSPPTGVTIINLFDVSL